MLQVTTWGGAIAVIIAVLVALWLSGYLASKGYAGKAGVL
jgi:hypothetical protein